MSVVKRALISVSDKSGVVDFARQLAARGVEILSTGGTARLLADAGIVVKEVSAHTGFPEIMDGRVKTLHPKIHGGLLGRRGQDDAVMEEHGIDPIDLLVVNLYPFEKTGMRRHRPIARRCRHRRQGGVGAYRFSRNHGWACQDPAPENPRWIARSPRTG